VHCSVCVFVLLVLPRFIRRTITASGVADVLSQTPLPATLPLFAGGLGFVGYLAKRRKNATPLAAA
jgi:hypothetical protein